MTLEIGKLSGVMADAIAFCFDDRRRGHAARRRRLDISQIDGRARCRDCGSEFAAETLFAACPCGSRRCERLAGEELNIKAIELEEAADVRHIADAATAATCSTANGHANHGA